MYIRELSSPWGAIQHIETLAPGIMQIHTDSHGGIYLTPERRLMLPAWARQIASTYCEKPAYWEEDCEALVPMYVFFDEMPEWVKKHGKAQIAAWIDQHEYLNFPSEAE